MPALASTDYLLQTTHGALRLLFDEAGITAASARPAHPIDILRAAERPRVSARLRLSIGHDVTIRPLLRGTGRNGRALARIMRALNHWDFGLNSANLRETPCLLDDLGPTAVARPVLESVGEPRFVVALHLFYEDLWPEFAFFLTRMSQPFHLIVTTPLVGSRLPNDVRRAFPRAEVVIVPNRGRDVGPFLHLLSQGAFDTFDFVLKLHGKRTSASGYGAALGHVWRRASLLDLAGADSTVSRIVGRFDEQADVGMIGSPRFRLPGKLMRNEEAWGTNRQATLQLAQRLGLNADAFELDFYAGTMFWARRAVLEPLRRLGLTAADFPEEDGQRDGGLHHAFERLFGAAPALVGMHLEDAPRYSGS